MQITRPDPVRPLPVAVLEVTQHEFDLLVVALRDFKTTRQQTIDDSYENGNALFNEMNDSTHVKAATDINTLSGESPFGAAHRRLGMRGL